MARRRRSPRALLIVLALLFGLVAGTLLGGAAWLRGFLRGDEFRKLVSRLTSERLGGEGEFLPLRWQGTAVHSEGFAAQGNPGRTVESLRADQIRCELALRAVLDGAWRLENLEIERARLVLRPVNASVPPPSPPVIAPERASVRTAGPGWLPRRFELPEARIRELAVLWGGDAPGSITGLHSVLRPEGIAWDLEGDGGHFALGTLPVLDVAHLRVRWQAPRLHLLEVALKDGPQGGVALGGIIGPGSEFDVRADLSAVPVERWLPSAWRNRLTGSVSGEMRVRRLTAGAPITHAGKLRMEAGQLTGLQVLDTIARYTRTDRFRNPVFQKVAGNYTFESGRLNVRDFEAESPGLVRVEGVFGVAGGNIDGTFAVGVTPASLRWLPGAEQRVFTTARGGYLWADMKVSGPLEAPREDLSARLIAAAPEAMIEEVRGAAGAAEGVLREGVGGLLDALLPTKK